MVGAKTAELISTAGVRRAFLDFFSQRGHALLPGSPVLPLGDPSVPFVPAGMHQFRSVLLGNVPPPASQVANSQRCIRVGGKHCDLATVGTDGSHLTFFEMLGSWTFGATSYWKREACADALNFLSGPLRVDPSRIHVTYFGGDPSQGLEADLECYEVWRSLGVPKERVLPFPAADNLWEMGLSGPCGPCTEIHVDNIEIWNLVFTQHQRSVDGVLSPLKLRSIDTGMGLERLSALLSDRSSVFDTDSLLPLLEMVCKYARATPYSGAFGDSDAGRRDAAYRLLVDHARTVAVALADGVVPDRHYKLRRIIRRALLIAERHFGVKDSNDAGTLLEELAVHTVKMLEEAHPTLAEGIPAIRQLLRHEVALFTKLRKKASRAWYTALAEEPRLAALTEEGISPEVLTAAWRSVAALPSKGFRTIPGTEAYRLYDTHGLDVDVVGQLAQLAGLQGIDLEGLAAERCRVKGKSRLKRAIGGKEVNLSDVDKLLPGDLSATDTAPVYSYSRLETGEYSFPSVTSKVLALVQNGLLVNDAVPNGGPVGAVISKTNFYRLQGGQEPDHGRFEFTGGHLKVTAPMDVGRVVVHWGELHGATLSVGDTVDVHIDADRRLSLMRNHTAVHLLNKCIREKLPVATQIRGPVASTRSELALDSYGKRFTIPEWESLENKARALVQASLPVKRKKVTPWNWYAATPIAFIPDAEYPLDDLFVVEIGKDSRELCGGTHVFNTADIKDLCVIKTDDRDGLAVTAVTGSQAVAALELGIELLKTSQKLAEDALAIGTAVDGKNAAELIEHYWKCQTAVDVAINAKESSYFLREKSVQILKNALREMEENATTGARFEVADAASKSRFTAVVVRYASILDKIVLTKYTRPLPDKALLLIAVLRDGSLRGRCCVPDDLLSDEFDARLWLSSVATSLGVQIVSSKEVDPKKVCIFQSAGSSKFTVEMAETIIEDARRFAEGAALQRASSV